jgi:hypothetical protein
MTFGRLVEGGADHFCTRHVLAKVRHFLRPLVDEQDDEHDLFVIG